MQDKVLVERILAGDRRSAEILVARFQNLVWHIVRAAPSLSKDLMSDAFQDVFVRLAADNYRALRQWRGSASLSAYIAAIARHCVADAVRRHLASIEQVIEMPVEPAPDPQPDEALLGSEIRRAIHHALEGLGPRDRELIERRHFRHQSYREIADAMGITVNHVGVALCRAEERMRRWLLRQRPDLFGADCTFGSP